MATYPSGIAAPRVVENKSGVVYDVDQKKVMFAEDINGANNEIVAIETELGTNPKSTYPDVSARLADFEARIYALENP